MSCNQTPGRGRAAHLHAGRRLSELRGHAESLVQAAVTNLQPQQGPVLTLDAPAPPRLCPRTPTPHILPKVMPLAQLGPTVGTESLHPVHEPQAGARTSARKLPPRRPRVLEEAAGLFIFMNLPIRRSTFFVQNLRRQSRRPSRPSGSLRIPHPCVNEHGASERERLGGSLSVLPSRKTLVQVPGGARPAGAARSRQDPVHPPIRPAEPGP